MQINVIHYKPHTLSLRPFKFFFQELHWFYSCKVVSSSDMRKNKVQSFVPILAVDMRLWFFYVSVSKVLTFCDAFLDIKQKM